MRFLVKGAVQGVGFRPFVKREAVKRDIKGWVRNTGRGVEVKAEGKRLKEFEEVLCQGPPLSRVESVVKKEDNNEIGLEGFQIKSSSKGKGKGTIPPDTATCSECLKDIQDEGRFQRYWAVSCVKCGPRFTISKKPPFDRKNTSMKEYPFCDQCLEEYEDVESRRFHAQAFSCKRCGPSLAFHPADGNENPLQKAKEYLAEGKIVAVKGLGGFHLACDAVKEEIIQKLRERLGRKTKPFAAMVPPAFVSKLSLSKKEEKLLHSKERPIVLIEKRGLLAENLAPSLKNVGLMLPYTGLHHLLVDKPLVMTSANFPGKPIIKENGKIFETLSDVAEGFLTHGREIVNRCDDSVTRISGREPRFLRRSRGWVPLPVKGDFGEAAAFGAEKGNVLSISDGESCFLSQFLGNIDNPGNVSYMEKSFETIKDISGVQPEGIVCDLHPSFLTTKLAEEIAEKNDFWIEKVQHHFAHICSVMAEDGLDQSTGIALDGFGYGPEGQAWGGEVLHVAGDRFERVGGLDYFPLPGADAAARRPSRIAAGILSGRKNVKNLLQEKGITGKEIDLSIQQARKGLNSPKCSSAGRFLDAVSAVLDICRKRRYEGEPALKLEAEAWGSSPLDIEVPFTDKENELRIDTVSLFTKLLQLSEKHSTPQVASTAQHSLAKGFAYIAVEQTGCKNISFSGGVAYNDQITSCIKESVESRGKRFYCNKKVPPGDGGLCLGQTYSVR